MKKITILLAFAMILGIGTTNAQEKIKVGGSLGYSTNISSLGIGIDGVYNINDKYSVAGDFVYFLESNLVSWMTIDVNAHYQFLEKEESTFYALGGLELLMGTINWDLGPYGSGNSTFSNVGLNLGAGTTYKLTDKLSIMGEGKFVIVDGSYLNIRAGVLYSL